MKNWTPKDYDDLAEKLFNKGYEKIAGQMLGAIFGNVDFDEMDKLFKKGQKILAGKKIRRK